MIIFHLQRKHNFHPRPESPLHLPTEEPVLGYLKFSAKGTKREVFGMLIPNDLITDDIRGAQYYDAFLEKVAKHQRYLAGEEVTTKKPKPAPAKPQDKKRKPVSETSEAPPPAKRPKIGKVIKKRTLKSSQQLVDEFVDEGVPLTEPRETGPGKLQPLPEVQGKGKEKRRTSASIEPSVHEDSSSLYAELGLSDSDTESDEEVPSIVKSGAQDEGQARPNPGKQDEG
ncbi:hypothetical protein Tco_0656558 [Tanacetum coccineum]|uniref:Histone deacetylase 14 n=1 Tax=Tanacetum coccineum TaxID=301880 RepID=A0ABQ4X942_9ASTR